MAILEPAGEMYEAASGGCMINITLDPRPGVAKSRRYERERQGTLLRNQKDRSKCIQRDLPPGHFNL